jgi:hypothetical protein
VAHKPQLRRAFLTFCQNDAEDWIECSKIINKEKHLKALGKYKSIFEKEEDIDSSNNSSSS